MGKIPLYQDVDGTLVPGFFDPDSFRAGISYKPLKDDLILSTYPKCGTTWTQHIVLLLYTKGEPFSASYFFQHSPFLEMAGPEMVEKMPRPGCIKTHLPYHLTPMNDQSKYIYVVRNPKDTSVSLFHHNRNFPGYQFDDGEFADFFECFVTGHIEWGDYMDHVLGWYEHRNDPNVLFITYESMKKDHRGSVVKIAKFLGSEYEKLVEDDLILDKIVEYSSVAYMKKHNDSSFTDLFSLPAEQIEKDPNVSKGLKAALKGLRKRNDNENREFNFIRKGIVGDWKTLYTPEQSKRMDEKFFSRAAGTDLADLFKDSGCFDPL